ncbi:MAG: fibronectin type III domain-containing protein [Chloroflexota bacterium]
MGEIQDFVMYDSATVFAACDGGFYGTTRFGPAKQRLTLESLCSIALQPGFDNNDPDNMTLVVGNDDGEIFASADGGNTWGDAEMVGGDSVYVAFDQLDEDQIYYVTASSEVGSATLDGNEVDDDGVLEDSEEDTAEATFFSGLWVAPDNALYAVGGETNSTSTSTTPSSMTIAGGITLTGDTSGAVVTNVAFSDALIYVSGPVFTSEAADPIVGLPTDVTATGYNSVAGVIYLTDAAATTGGYFEFSATGLTLDVPATPFSEGEGVTIAEGATVWNITVTPTSTTTVTATAGPDKLFRLLLGEPYNIWEMETKNGAQCIWGFSGSNFVFTVVGNDELFGLKDTLSGKVAGVTVSSIGETKATVSWSAMTGAKEYEVMYDSDSVFTTKLTTTLSGLDDDTDYEVMVRVATDKAFQSRWSTAVEFTTLQAIAQPENLVPSQGMQNAPLLPSFVWTEISNAVEYEFQLSTDPAFGSLLVDETLEITAYTLETELAYDTNHYWRVRAVSDTGTKSTWCFSNFHTRTEAIPPVTVEPPPTPTIILPTPQVTVIPPDVNITLPAPQVTVIPPDITVDVPPVVTVTQQAQPTLVLPEAKTPATPVYIWVIVGIGAVLVIAVIVLIIRTRRVV